MGRRAWVPVGLIFTACMSQAPETPQQVAPIVTRFSYEDGDWRYDYTSLRTVEQEVAGETTRTTRALRYRVSTSIQPAGETRAIQFSVDTILEAVGPGLTPTTGRAVTGMRLDGVFHPTGRITDLTIGDQRSTLLSYVTNAIEQFFPLIPAQGVEPGMEWTDTTVVVTDDGSTSITATSVIHSLARDWETDQRMLPITWRAEYTLEGAGQQMGQGFTLEGSGVTVGEHFVSAGGVYVSTSARDSSVANVHLPTLGLTVPVVQVGVDSVRIVR